MAFMERSIGVRSVMSCMSHRKKLFSSHMSLKRNKSYLIMGFELQTYSQTGYYDIDKLFSTFHWMEGSTCRVLLN